MKDRRKNFRVEWTSPASIEPEGRRPRIPCVVKNLSNGGARIACAAKVPDEFMLRLTPGRGRLRACRVAWRRGDEIGVQFIDLDDGEGVPVERPIAEPVG